LLQSVGLEARGFESGEALLVAYDSKWRGCVLLDIRMPGLSGLEVQEHLNVRLSTLPVIFITAYADVPMAVRAMRNGAFDFLEKPFRDQKLLDCFHRALDANSSRSEELRIVADILNLLERLTPREREVMNLMVKGKLNKIIADEMGISPRTVEVHRSRVMSKMEVDSLAELVRLVVRVE
jgi:two-component system response regulator FixJ